jgi:hypothetical protein
MYGAVAEFVTTQQGDSAEFMGKARALAIGVARDSEPARLYVIRIDNWFGPRWMLFAGKAIGLVGVHKTRLHIPPFVPSRVVEQLHRCISSVRANKHFRGGSRTSIRMQPFCGSARSRRHRNAGL